LLFNPSLLQKKEQQHVTRTITFWRNGFTVDDGPLRNVTDPENQEFLRDINNGIVPREMAGDAGPNVTFSTNLVDNRAQERKEPPKPKVTAFAGSGHALGSSTTTSAPVSTPPPSNNNNVKPAGSSYTVDESQPFTSIQLRLHDGTRLVAKFNLSHTVADIRRFVESAKRLGPGQNYDLMLTFPQKVLNEVDKTVGELGLQNAVIVQKLR